MAVVSIQLGTCIHPTARIRDGLCGMSCYANALPLPLIKDLEVHHSGNQASVGTNGMIRVKGHINSPSGYNVLIIMVAMAKCLS